MKKLVPVLLLAFIAIGAWWYLQEDSTPTVTEQAREFTPEATPADSLVFKAIPQTDLPPEGTRSLFDHLIAENGVLPWPYEDLVAMVNAWDRGQANARRTGAEMMIPDGRSLLKAEAGFAKPRLLTAPDARPPKTAQLGPMLKGRLFMGFVEEADEIEVVSYNEMAGRFEFQLVKDYREGGVPQIVYAKRAICLTCHQSEGPIFSVRPWEETNAHPKVADAVVTARNSAEDYFGQPIQTELKQPEAFDALTDVGNMLPVVQRLWLDGCGANETGAECRRLLLQLAVEYLLDPASLTLDRPEARRLVELQQANWPAQGFAVPNNDLASRDPFNRFATGESRLTRLMGRLRDRLELDEDKIAAFEKLPPLPPELDPLTPRPPKRMLQATDLDAVYAVSQMFSTADREWLEEQTNYGSKRIAGAMSHPAIAEQIQPLPFRRIPVMQALLGALGTEPIPASCCTDASKLSAPIVEGTPPLDITDGSVLELFETYCFACHRGNPSANLDFMNGETEADVLAQIEARSEIADVLDYERYIGTDKAAKLMPPGNSYQRALLEQAMAEGRDDHERMQAVVPSLFDF